MTLAGLATTLPEFELLCLNKGNGEVYTLALLLGVSSQQLWKSCPPPALLEEEGDCRVAEGVNWPWLRLPVNTKQTAQ